MHNVGEEVELNENEFLRMFLGPSASGSIFEEMLRKKFSRAAANVQKFRAVSKVESERTITKDLDEKDGGFPLHDLLMYADDFEEAFDFTDSFMEREFSDYMPTQTVKDVSTARKHFSTNDAKVSPLASIQASREKRASC